MKLEWKTCLRAGISAFVLFLAVYYWKGLEMGFELFVSALRPLIIGGIVAYILNIPMSFYERHLFARAKSERGKGARRVVCMIAAILTILGVIAGVVGLIIPELTECITLLINTIIPDVIRWAEKIVAESEPLAQIIPVEALQTLENVDWQNWLTRIVSFLGNGIGGAVGSAVGAITSAFSGVVTGVLSFIFSLYLLLGKDRLLNQGKRLMKSYLPAKWRERISHVLDVLDDCFHRYVVGQCLEAVILGGLCIVGMLIFRFPYATMIGTLIGFTALIPIAGAYIGAAVGAVMILTVSPIQAVLFVLFLVILQQLEGNLIYPKVVGTSIGLPGIWVLAAVTVGGSLSGITGMLIGVPLAAAVYRLIREDVRRREGNERTVNARKRRETRENSVKKNTGASKDTKVNTDAKVNAKAKADTKSKANQETKANAETKTDTETKTSKVTEKNQAPEQKNPEKSVKQPDKKMTEPQATALPEMQEGQTAAKKRRRRKKKRKSSDQTVQSGQKTE